MAEVGDYLEVKTHSELVQGILMPSSQEDVVIVKLDNGYNIGLEKKDILSMRLIKKKEPVDETPKPAPEKKKGLKNIVVLHTGGTIASKVDYKSGGVSAKFSAADLIEMVPELQNVANVDAELVANMMSEDMTFDDYKKLISAVEKHIGNNVDGIIIGHGTDTLGYTAAALSFAFEKINIPVLLVGSQRSSDRGSSDAAMNLLCAARFIADSDFVGVAVCMHHGAGDEFCAILPGTKTRKMHTSRRDAFKAINDSPIATVDYNSGKIKFLKEDYSKKSKNNELIIKGEFSEEASIVKTHPNMDSRLFNFFTKTYQGFVIEGTGLGHAPTNLGENNLRNYELLKEFISSGGIVAITSQCLFGGVHPSVYTNLRRLSEIGCVFCEDMLPETAYIKLAWLLGNYPKEKVKELMNQNLRGEINLSRTYNTEFIE
jgi:glutamyl-tRNA(Gln) amidotransferase subunit D